MTNDNRTLQDIVDQADGYLYDDYLDDDYYSDEWVFITKHKVSNFETVILFKTTTDFHFIWRVLKKCSASCTEILDITTYEDAEIELMDDYAKALGCKSDNEVFYDAYPGDLILEIGDNAGAVYTNADIVIEFEGTTTIDTLV
jgi:hypothetical protein